jgi:integrase
MNEHIAQALMAWRQESVCTAPTDWVWASASKKGTQPLWLATIMRYYIQPAARRAGINKKIGWHTFRQTFSTLIKSLGVDAKVVQELLRHASFKTTMDGYTQALEEPKRQAQAALADLIMCTGRISRMILTNVVECCGIYGQDAANFLICWRPRRDLNPCYRRERAMS